MVDKEYCWRSYTHLDHYETYENDLDDLTTTPGCALMLQKTEKYWIRSSSHSLLKLSQNKVDRLSKNREEEEEEENEQH